MTLASLFEAGRADLRTFVAIRAQLAGQALAGIGQWTPVPNRAATADAPEWDLRTPEAQRLRAEWAVAQADAVLAALGVQTSEPLFDAETGERVA